MGHRQGGAVPAVGPSAVHHGASAGRGWRRDAGWAKPGVAVAFVVALLIGGAARAAEAWTDAIAKSEYDGLAINRGLAEPVVTTFRVEPDGRVTGRYRLTESDGDVVEGTLTPCHAVRPLTLVCVWNDRYGTGPVQIDFGADAAGFVARWAAPDRGEWLPWSGFRRPKPVS